MAAPDILRLTGHGTVRFLDQTLLPGEERVLETADVDVLIEAIRALRVRGAPLLGIAAAYGSVLAAYAADAGDDAAFRISVHAAMDRIAAARPTAVNLFWALGRMRDVLDAAPDPAAARGNLREEALRIHADDASRCAAIGRHGAELIPRDAGIITHCNTGALATGGDGTAFAVLLEAHRQGRGIHVYADETRPLLQGARLTMWELLRHGIPSTLITDGTAAMRMRQGGIALVITGADRIAANGDTANKIGTYALAIAARHHGIPFYIAAPVSTIDRALPDGSAIPIEERSGDDVRRLAGVRVTPDTARVYAPAFDVTPHELITAIITEHGIIRPPYHETLGALCARADR